MGRTYRDPPANANGRTRGAERLEGAANDDPRSGQQALSVLDRKRSDDGPAVRGVSPMQWFYIQHLFTNVSTRQVDAQYDGPFYGNPLAMLPNLGSGDHVMVYGNGAWIEFVPPRVVSGM